MKSIRLSLITYFLLLLAIALGAVSLLAYEISAHALRERQGAHATLIFAQSQAARKEMTTQFDQSLLARARALAFSAQVQVQFNRLYWMRPQTQLTMLTILGTQSHLLAPLWICIELVMESSDIQLDESLLHTGEDRASDLFQIKRPRGGEWHSKSLGNHSLPQENDEFTAMQMLDWKCQDITLDGKNWRRILFKAPILHFSILGGTSRPNDRPRSQATPLPPSGQPAAGQGRPRRIGVESPFWIQYAVDRTDFENQLREIDIKAVEKLNESEGESRQSLSELRQKLWWISGATFGGVCLGAFLVITIGLAPLRRLTDAVSRVSENNFKLDMRGRTPPSELRPIVGRLRDSLAQLQKAFDREKQATADISHELRTPLAGLMTTVDVTLRKTRTPEEYRESLKDCRDIIRQMTQMVERLLTLTWLDARSDRVKSEPVDVNMLANQCAAVVRPLAKARGLTLNVYADTPAIIRADQDKLREVMSNLLHNAVEYNKPNGSIDLRIRSSTSGLDLEVRDTGIGISPEHRERIFERFFRADESRQEAGLHAGLGLAIVRGYVDLMGGTISVESEVGRGSAFRVHIPAPQV